jgi:oxygen-independent coproporphyrinogen-3 oxidase
MNARIVEKYSAPVPRYTSYPTAPHFLPAIDGAVYEGWLKTLPEEAALSLYVHIPFCHELCWYCGCNTKASKRYGPIAAYAGELETEIARVAQCIPRTHHVQHIHWGGGSPNALSPEDIVMLDAALRANFKVPENVEFAVEIDPRNLTREQVRSFALAGVTRVSFGVQDFNCKVQAAINRIQSFAETRNAVSLFRDNGIDAINIDLVYGLPHQTRDSVEATMRQVLELAPSRLAIFGYAHLPSKLRHQRLIDEASLPNAVERFAQANRLSTILAQAGYVRIGLDHFARPDDPLATQSVNRNFQGYTTDHADALIGLGASAIGKLPQGYVQNAVAIGDYARRIRETGFATTRGIAFTEDDRIRGYVIERLMCDFEFPRRELEEKFGAASRSVIDEAELLLESEQDHLIERTSDGFRVTNKGRPFVRSIAACFDSYLGKVNAQHSMGV